MRMNRLIPLPVMKPCISSARLIGQERFPEHADAEIDRLRQRQFLPLPQQRFLRAQRLGPAFEQHARSPVRPTASRPPCGATTSTSPQASAVGASIFSAVITSQRARPQPISRGNSAAWITEGMPTRTSGMPNLASCAATRKSQAAATSSPPPRHQPGIRAMTGAGKARTASQRSRRREMKASADCLVERRHLLDVGAADHALLALARQHQHADRPVGGELFQALADAVDDGGTQDIQRAGVADRERGRRRGDRGRRRNDD